MIATVRLALQPISIYTNSRCQVKFGVCAYQIRTDFSSWPFLVTFRLPSLFNWVLEHCTKILISTINSVHVNIINSCRVRLCTTHRSPHVIYLDFRLVFYSCELHLVRICSTVKEFEEFATSHAISAFRFVICQLSPPFNCHLLSTARNQIKQGLTRHNGFRKWKINWAI